MARPQNSHIIFTPTEHQSNHFSYPPNSTVEMVSVRDIMTYHKMDRRLYETVLRMGRLPALARNIVALWMWLELIGIDVIHYVKNISDPSLLLNFIKEAETILNIIRQASPLPPFDNDEWVSLPFMVGFASEPINLRFFYCHSDVVVRGLTYLLDGVGAVIFNDPLFHMLNVYERAVSVAHQQGTSPPVMPEELANQYNSRVTPSPEDYRSLFITFSRRCTLTREEIVQYFNERMGQCVERVMLERTALGVTPMYGRIVFVSEALNEILLNGERTVKVVIKGNEVWGRKYVPRISRA